MCILDRDTGRIKKMVAAHDVGKAVNPLSVEGQIEGGVVMSMGYALTEKYPIDENCKPTAKYGMLGLFRANQIPPEIQAIVVEKPGLNVAGGAIGIGEITSIPTAPAIADAYYRLTGEREFSSAAEEHPLRTQEINVKEHPKGCSFISVYPLVPRPAPPPYPHPAAPPRTSHTAAARPGGP
ncbi:MAG: molybdopterin cofactor-binding domain-containing protein [Oscillospiraceae bacterium]